MTKADYEARRALVKDQRMAEETAYAARMRKEAAADECITVLMEALTAFLTGKAALYVAPSGGAGCNSIRFAKDTERHDA